MATSVKTRSRPDERRRDIKVAAIRLFKRYGVQKTSMEDISAASGMSRRTVYNLFSNRQEIIFEVLYDRVMIIAEKVRKATDLTNFESAIVSSSIATIDLVLSDPVYRAIYQEDPSIGILSGGDERNPRMDEVTLSIFADVLALGRAEGVVRPELSDTELADWVRSFHYLLIMHQLRTPEMIDEMIRKFFIPSVR